MKRQFKDKILPPNHPAVVRVARIAQKTINSAMEGVHRGAEAQLNYSLNVPHQQNPSLASEKDIYREKDQVLDDVWIEETRKDGLQKGRKASTKHIDDFKWEIVVVNANVVNAACLPGGKIIVFTGILREFPDDDQIATVIGHEVGHAIARHSAEMLTKSIFIGFIELLLLAIVQVPDAVATASQLLLRLPFSRKMEMEADHMGLLIMAGAGYNPRVAPSVYLKLGSLQKLPEYAQYISTHPSGKKRAQALISSKAMQEAITIHESKQGGWDSIGFHILLSSTSLSFESSAVGDLSSALQKSVFGSYHEVESVNVCLSEGSFKFIHSWITTCSLHTSVMPRRSAKTRFVRSPPTTTAVVVLCWFPLEKEWSIVSTTKRRRKEPRLWPGLHWKAFKNMQERISWFALGSLMLLEMEASDSCSLI